MDILILPLLCGLIVTLMTGPLGCFVVWRRMAYFGDTLAHGALIGIALGLLLNLNLGFAVMLVSVVIGVALMYLRKQSSLSNDTLLGILSHGALALGLVCFSLFEDRRVDLYGFLFGDLLTVQGEDVVMMAILGGAVLVCLAWAWSDLLRTTLHEELAKVEGVATEWMNILLMLLIAVVIAFAMRVVGVLLITALLIMPAAAARLVTNSPESMAFLAAGLGAAAVILGLTTSWLQDTPAGPSIVLSATFLFLAIRLFKRQQAN